MEEQIMRHAIEPANHAGRDGSTTFVIGAVLCAAVIATLFTLHGGPDLLAGRLPSLAPLSGQSP